MGFRQGVRTIFTHKEGVRQKQRRVAVKHADGAEHSLFVVNVGVHTHSWWPYPMFDAARRGAAWRDETSGCSARPAHQNRMSCRTRVLPMLMYLPVMRLLVVFSEYTHHFHPHRPPLLECRSVGMSSFYSDGETCVMNSSIQWLIFSLSWFLYVCCVYVYVVNSLGC